MMKVSCYEAMNERSDTKLWFLLVKVRVSSFSQVFVSLADFFSALLVNSKESLQYWGSCVCIKLQGTVSREELEDLKGQECV